MNKIGEHEHTSGASSSRGRWLLLPIVLLAATLPGLVVADRWLHIQGMAGLAREPWCQVEALCQTALPSYVGVGLACWLAAFLLILIARTSLKLPEAPSWIENAHGPANAPDAQARRAGRILRLAALAGFLITTVAGLHSANHPGWGYLAVVLAYVAGCVLEQTALDDLRRTVRSHGPSLAICGSALLGLLFLLGGDYASRPIDWLVGVALLVPLVLRVRQGRPLPVGFWIAAGVIVLYAQGINSWRYAIVGDEYIFHEHARSITDSQGWVQIGRRLFDGQGVYGTHPYFSTVIQAAFMRLLGTGSYGWRISNAVVVALSAVAFLAFLRGFLPRRTAILGAFLLVISHYLINFSKIGYNNVQALLGTTLVLSAGSLAARSRRSLAFTGLGLAMGLCLYVYPAALYALPLGILLPWVVMPTGQKPSLRHWGSALAAFSLLLLPLLLQADYWRTKVAGTVFFSPGLLESSGSLLAHIGSNLLYTLVSYAYTIEETHFVVSSFVDPLTAAFVPIGLALCFKQVREHRFSRFLLVGFLLEAVLVGATHDRQFPPVTRMFLLLPWWIAFAAIGIASVVENVGRGAWRRGVLVGMACAAFGLNLYQAIGLFHQRYEGKASFEVLFLRLLERDAIQDPSHPKSYFFLTDSTWGIDGMYTQQMVYSLPNSPDLLGRAVVENASLENDVAAAIANPDTAVIIQPWMDRDLIEKLRAVLNALGKTECPVREAIGTDVRFSMWLSPELASLCRRANPPGADSERFSLLRVPLSSWILILSGIALLAWRRGLVPRWGERDAAIPSPGGAATAARAGMHRRLLDRLKKARPAHRQRIEAQGPSEISFRVASGTRLRLTIETLADWAIEPPSGGEADQDRVVFNVGLQADEPGDPAEHRETPANSDGQSP